MIGGLTVVMAGGVSPRPKAVAKPEPGRIGDQSDPMTEPLDLQPSAESEVEAHGVEEAGDEDGSNGLEPQAQLEPETELEPAPPPPAVTPAPDLEDVEDLMFVDADIEADGDRPPRPQR